MPRIPVHTVDSEPPTSREALKALEKKYGKMLNIHGEMAHAAAGRRTQSSTHYSWWPVNSQPT